MAISPYFHHQTFKTEQKLIEDLTRETIYLRGNDYMYIPREKVHLDDLFGEDPKSSFKKPVIIEMYCMGNMDGFGGPDMFTKFGLQFQHETTFQVSKVRFKEEMSKVFPDIVKPQEGDLIYHDLSNYMFEITYVEDQKPFFTTGIYTVWEMQCKHYVHNYDDIKIDIPKREDIDQFIPYEHNVNRITEIEHEDNDRIIQKESDDIMNFDENDPFSESPSRGSTY